VGTVRSVAGFPWGIKTDVAAVPRDGENRAGLLPKGLMRMDDHSISDPVSGRDK